MAMVGMDTGVVRQIGHDLKNQASQIHTVISTVDRLVNNASANWKGKDAQDFHSWWTGQHRPHLVDLQHKLEGLGTSAINNANEQDNVSNH